MKAEIFRPFKTAGLVLANAAQGFVSPLRCLCFCSRGSKTVILGMEPRQLRYLLNTSLILLFALLHAADGIITYFGLKFNYAAEANPVLLFFASTMGLGLSIFALKLLCMEFIAVVYFARRNIGSCWGTATLFSADAFYSWVVSNNVLLVLGT
ncbi:DUF5658 family protein [Methylomonas sp. SURF-2]|uniref:DUF5658 family protein n=1 Tax=Methylomonas subterranea TaxID=2952225 RepID=A0ABT1TE10_9GAMM|nr:DUF5658 family protein [Methylomonas sp. SURF-2]MCQ8103686.1 DUF5658 family protein [Methylomonas sp. SURF-2]